MYGYDVCRSKIKRFPSAMISRWMLYLAPPSLDTETSLDTENIIVTPIARYVCYCFSLFIFLIVCLFVFVYFVFNITHPRQQVMSTLAVSSIVMILLFWQHFCACACGQAGDRGWPRGRWQVLPHLSYTGRDACTARGRARQGRNDINMPYRTRTRPE